MIGRFERLDIRIKDGDERSRSPHEGKLEAGLEAIRLSPPNRGVLTMIVRLPRVGERETLREGQLDLVQGLLGDSWIRRGSSRSPDGVPHPDMQLNVMNARAVALIARQEGRWALAGDQLYVDLDLSRDNLPPGTRLAIGNAVIEVSALPHTGCGTFVERFGVDAMKFVNGTIGRQLNLRGINARVVQPGTIRVRDTVTKT